MDGFTPAVVSALDLLNGTKCDSTEITKNLFKDHKPSIAEDQKRQRLETYLRIRSLETCDLNERKKCYQVLDGTTLLAIPPKLSNASKETAKRFNFTKIFDEKANQSAIYDSCGLPIVRRFLEGHNGLLFAYGITSSGKSYTMRGSTEHPGIIPRALNSIFDVIGSKIEKEVPFFKPESFSKCLSLSAIDRSLEEDIRQFIFNQNDKSFQINMNSFKSQISVINETNHSLLMNDVLHSTFRSDSNINCSVWISFYEIYNEELNDLLELEIEGEKKRKPKILKDRSDNYFVSDLRQICVSSAEQAYKVLLFGQNNLHISSTDLNKNSSRSHCAFNISLITTSSHLKRSTYNINHLSICDLAGAERSDKANNSGDRIREAGKINGSLLSLSRVISAVRYNQKFEHDQSKQRFVNYRDSKLTKIFQPFFSGSGMAAIISTMNPSPNLFDETFFALKFTGVVSQVVVNYDDNRNKLHDSLKRLTQVWMQSSQRWSNFAHLKPPKPSVSIINVIKEEDECDDDEDNKFLDITAEDLERKINEITRMDLSKADPQEIEVLQTQIDFLVEKLKQTENEKMEMEMEVRRQVVAEFNKMIADMEEMANNKDKAKKKLEEMMTQRLINNENLHKQEKLELRHKINELENENFRITEKLCQLREESKGLVHQKETELKILKEENKKLTEELELRSKELESKLISNGKVDQKCYKDVCTSPASSPLVRDAQTSIVVSESDANTSAINFINFQDANTSAIDLLVRQKMETADKMVGTVLSTNDQQTWTFSSELMDQMTNTSVHCLDKSTSVCNTSSLNIKENDRCSPIPIAIDNHNEIAVQEIDETILSRLSPKTVQNSITREEYQNLLEKLKHLENCIKEKDAQITFNQRITLERDAKLKALQDENKRLTGKVNSDFGLQHIFKSKPSSVTAFSVTSKSVPSEDSASVTSVDSNDIKPKKSAKYSSRKRKQNADTSLDKRYLSSINDLNKSSEDKCSLSQESSNSVESCADEIGNNVFSTKKRSIRQNKRRVDNSIENEEYKPYRGPESKRKRPPLRNLYCSPISPILSAERVTRSKAKKSLKF